MAMVQEKVVAYTATGFCDNVLQTLYELQQSQKLCDVFLEAKDGLVSVHSLVFAACSTFFQKWLLQKPVQKRNKLIFPVSEVTLIQLKALIEFFYTGRLIVTTENVDAYHSLFEKLCIEEAVALCHEFVASQMKTATTEMDIKSANIETIQEGSSINKDHEDNFDGSILLEDDNINDRSVEKYLSEPIQTNDNAHLDSDKHFEDKNSNAQPYDKNNYTSISRKQNGLNVCVGKPVTSDNLDVTPSSSVVDDNTAERASSDPVSLKGSSSNSTSQSFSPPVRRSERMRRASAKSVALNQEKEKIMKRKSIKKETKSASVEKPIEKKIEKTVEKVKQKENKRKAETLESTADENNASETSSTKCTKLEFTVSQDKNVKRDVIKMTTKKIKKNNDSKKYRRRKKPRTYEFECEFCSHSSVNSKALDMHKHSKHDIPFDPSRHTVYTCEICGYATLMSARLDIHVASHSDDRPFVCESCGKSFKLSCELTMHAKVHKYPTMLDCSQCGKTFSTVYNLKDHLEHQHYGRKKFLCHLCCHRAVNKLHLDRHLYKVHGIPLPPKCKLFSCDLCDFESFKQYRFTEHIKRHKGEKDYVCVVCKKGFVSKPALLRHMIWHGEKKFKCTFGDCQYATVQKKSLDEHIRLMHTGKDVKPFMCHLCPHRSGLKGNLDKHLRSVHKLDLVDRRKIRYRYSSVFDRSLDISSDDFSLDKVESMSVVKKEPEPGEENQPVRQAQFEAALNEAIARSMKFDGNSESEKYLNRDSDSNDKKSQITQTVQVTETDPTWPLTVISSANSSNPLDIQADSSVINDYNTLQDVTSTEYTSQNTDETSIIIRELDPVQAQETSALGNIRLEEGANGTQLTVICDSKSEAFSVLESVGFKFI